MQRAEFALRAGLRAITLFGVIVAGGPASATVSENVVQQQPNELDRLIRAAQREMLARPNQALRFARQAVELTVQPNRSQRYRDTEATALWLEAEALTRTSRVAEARIVANRASKLAEDDGKLTKLDGDLALTRARIAESTGEIANALKNYQQADAIYMKLALFRNQSLALLGLGDLYEKAHDFARDSRYYREAARISPRDAAIRLAVANNLGFAYEQMGQYNNAIPRFEEALTIATSLKNALLQERILNNLALSYARTQKLAEADRDTNSSLALSKQTGSDEDIRLTWGVKAEIDFQRRDYQAASADLQKVFRGYDFKNAAPAFRDMHEIAYRVYRATGDLSLAIINLEAFKHLDDDARLLAASANLALVGAQFDFTKQDLEIARLRSAELERDIKLRKSQAETQRLVFAGILVAALLLVCWILWRSALLQRHRNDIAMKNRELISTLSERDAEIALRREVETKLRFAMNAAEQASRAKSHFLANMSHELRTPLNAIIGFSELIQGGRIKPEKTQEYAGDIAFGGRHLLAVLNNVLDMARIGAGELKLDERVVRIGNVVDHAVSVLGGRNAFSGKEIRTSGDADVLLHGDEVRLRQVILNLVSNSVKFTGEGGIVEVHIDRSADGLNIIVTDNGEGIPPDKLPMIMEPFVQAESAYARSHGGVGLGLPIVKSLVELHGGTVTIESECGRGTVARVHIPSNRIVDDQNKHAIVR